jgi:hypothetical protein
MSMSRLAAIVLGSALLFALACNKQDNATKTCLSAAGSYEDCGTACSISKSDEACKKWQTQTLERCEQDGKQACAELCEADDNEAACTKAKAM